VWLVHRFPGDEPLDRLVVWLVHRFPGDEAPDRRRRLVERYGWKS